jgi:hypothetical protein
MEFTYIADGIDAVVVDNFFNEDQLQEIHTELTWLTKPSVMLSKEQTMAAADENGILTSKRGVFLENVFKDWRHSALISHSMKQTGCEEFRNSLLSFNTLFKSVFDCNSRSHLLSYYEQSDYYKPHTDGFFFTILTYFNKEPKQFSGGEINLYSVNTEKKATIEPMNNRAVVIASCTVHEVTEIKSEYNNELSGFGRYCNSIFLTYHDSRMEQNK